MEHVVVIDDDTVIITLVRQTLKENDIRVTPMKSGATLFDFLPNNTADLILLDMLMPDMDGIETYKRLREYEDAMKRPHIPVVFMTGADDDTKESMALELGAIDFIKKPFSPRALLLRVRRSIELVRLQTKLEEEVIKKTKENERLSIQLVQTLAEAIDAKDSYTNGHSERVAAYSKEIAKRYGYDTAAQDEIHIMGLLHDVGKIGIPDSIITKPGRLTDEEYAVIKTHPALGYKILSKIKESPQLAIGARWHHERYDGKGYPDGLKGNDIPEQARIIAVADAYDAMSSRRSYRDSMEQDKILEQIVQGKGTQFDPDFAEIMIDMINEDTEFKMRG